MLKLGNKVRPGTGRACSGGCTGCVRVLFWTGTSSTAWVKPLDPVIAVQCCVGEFRGRALPALVCRGVSSLTSRAFPALVSRGVSSLTSRRYQPVEIDRRRRYHSVVFSVYADGVLDRWDQDIRVSFSHYNCT